MLLHNWWFTLLISYTWPHLSVLECIYYQSWDAAVIVKCTIMYNLIIVGPQLPEHLCAPWFLKELSPFVQMWYQSAASSMEYAFLVYHTCEHFRTCCFCCVHAWTLLYMCMAWLYTYVNCTCLVPIQWSTLVCNITQWLLMQMAKLYVNISILPYPRLN